MKRLIPALLVMCGHASAAVVLSDSIFNESSWTSFVDSPGTFTAGQVPGGGNPGSYWAISISGLPFAGLGALYQENLFETVYNPSVQGAITSIDARFEASFPDAALTKPPLPLAFVFIMEQAGTIYFKHGGPLVNTASWSEFNFSIPLASGPHPNFTSTGSPIKFGFGTYLINTAPCAAPCGTGAVDNWSVIIHQEGDAAPEPATWLLLAPPMLFIARRRHRR